MSVLKLFSGEIIRLVKYKILPVGVATTAIWVAILYFLEPREELYLAPMFIFIDVGAMSILLIGASHFLEKQEGTIKSLMVMPVTKREILISKTAASTVLALESAVITAAALYFIHKITLNYALLFLFVIIAGAAHAAIGFVLSLIGRDFTSMLGIMAAYMFIFTIPSIFYSVGLIDEKYKYLMMVSPSHASNELIRAAVSGEYETGLIIAGCVYLILLAAVLFRFAVYPMFKDKAVRG